jgi:outer membrane receptor protein involved in Fe transport
MANPEPEAINLLNFNLDLDLYKWTGFKKGRSIFTFRIENLFNEKVYVPTLAYSGTPNSFPYGPGRTFYAGLRINF